DDASKICIFFSLTRADSFGEHLVDVHSKTPTAKCYQRKKWYFKRCRNRIVDSQDRGFQRRTERAKRFAGRQKAAENSMHYRLKIGHHTDPANTCNTTAEWLKGFTVEHAPQQIREVNAGGAAHCVPPPYAGIDIEQPVFAVSGIELKL